jgi:hypothetical protein
MRLFFKFLFIAYLIMSISSQAFAGNLCCEKNLKNTNNNVAKSSDSKMPCHKVDNKTEDNSIDQNSDNDKNTHTNCCCDMGNCMAKIFFKSPSANTLTTEAINFSTPSTSYISQSVSLTEQPPKHSA